MATVNSISDSASTQAYSERAPCESTNLATCRDTDHIHIGDTTERSSGSNMEPSSTYGSTHNGATDNANALSYSEDPTAEFHAVSSSAQTMSATALFTSPGNATVSAIVTPLTFSAPLTTSSVSSANSQTTFTSSLSSHYILSSSSSHVISSTLSSNSLPEFTSSQSSTSSGQPAPSATFARLVLRIATRIVVLILNISACLLVIAWPSIIKFIGYAKILVCKVIDQWVAVLNRVMPNVIQRNVSPRWWRSLAIVYGVCFLGLITRLCAGKSLYTLIYGTPETLAYQRHLHPEASMYTNNNPRRSAASRSVAEDLSHDRFFDGDTSSVYAALFWFVNLVFTLLLNVAPLLLPLILPAFIRRTPR